MGGLIILEQLVEEEGPVIEEELAPVGEAIAADAEAVAARAEAAAKVVEAEAEKLAGEAEAEGEAVLSKIENALGDGEVEETVTQCQNDPFVKLEEAASQSTKPEWLQRIQAGNEFNKIREPFYDYNEVYIENPEGGYFRLDSYNPEAGEIVSRKFTQFSAIQESTGIQYLNELAAKYPPGATIADVPSSGVLAGQPLAGQMILEVPPQTAPIPQSVLETAERLGILIRDTNETTY
jgi:hypothetical protein